MIFRAGGAVQNFRGDSLGDRSGKDLDLCRVVGIASRRKSAKKSKREKVA